MNQPQLKITKIPTFNSVVIKQYGGHFFVSAPNSIVISKESLITILEGLLKFEFISEKDLVDITTRNIGVVNENQEDSGGANIREGGSRKDHNIGLNEKED